MINQNEEGTGTYQLVLFESLCQGDVVEVVESIDGGFETGVVLLVNEKPVQGLINSLKSELLNYYKMNNRFFSVVTLNMIFLHQVLVVTITVQEHSIKRSTYQRYVEGTVPNVLRLWVGTYLIIKILHGAQIGFDQLEVVGLGEIIHSSKK